MATTGFTRFTTMRKAAHEGRPRYWVYVHDKDGDIVKTIYEGNDLQEAMAEVMDYFGDQTWHQINMTETARIVDNHLQDGTTIWMAGPKERGE